jgi:hypothetical protein
VKKLAILEFCGGAVVLAHVLSIYFVLSLNTKNINYKKSFILGILRYV